MNTHTANDFTVPMLPQSYPAAERAASRLSEYANLLRAASARGDLHAMKTHMQRCVLQLRGVDHAIELAEGAATVPAPEAP